MSASPVADRAATPANTLIAARDLQMRFASGPPVLRDVNLQIAAGEFVSILGPSGCGKSTLLRLIAGLLEPAHGQLTLDHQEPRLARRTSIRTAFVFQDPTLLPWRTVAQNIALPLELDGVARSERPARVDEALSLIGLIKDDAYKRPRKLSGGQRMRVSLARALVTQPKLLLMDEPFAALDDVLRQQLNEELVRLWQARGCTTLFVTHNVSEAVFLSQRVLIMSRRPGTIVAEHRIPFGLPRTNDLRGTAEFAQLTAELSRSLREAGYRLDEKGSRSA